MRYSGKQGGTVRNGAVKAYGTGKKSMTRSI